MPKYYAEYDLANGYIHHWLVAGPQARSVENLAQFQGEDWKLQVARHYYVEEPLVEGEPIDMHTSRWTGRSCAGAATAASRTTL